jgi:hypothetical protein
LIEPEKQGVNIDVFADIMILISSAKAKASRPTRGMPLSIRRKKSTWWKNAGSWRRLPDLNRSYRPGMVANSVTMPGCI